MTIITDKARVTIKSSITIIQNMEGEVVSSVGSNKMFIMGMSFTLQMAPMIQ